MRPMSSGSGTPAPTAGTRGRCSRSRGRERQRLALESAERYAAIFDRTGAYYPGVNAATMHLVADRRSVSRSIASRVLDALAANGDGSYYAVATEAEARLLLGDVERA